MPSTSTQAARGRYIIHSVDGQQLAELVASLRTEPGLDVVDVIGPAGQPHTAVVEMDPQTAALLAQRLRSSTSFTIEPDRPLSLFK